MADVKKLIFGLKHLPDEESTEAPAWWGARAIIERQRDGTARLDIVWDRQSLQPIIPEINHPESEHAAETQALVNALNGGALDAYREYFKTALPEKELADGDVDKVTLKGTAGDVTFYGSTRCSAGYWYISARLASVPPTLDELLARLKKRGAIFHCPEHLGETLAFAVSIGKVDHFLAKLYQACFPTFFGTPCETHFSKDFALHSFYWEVYRAGRSPSKESFQMNGGLIYHDSDKTWSIHT